MVTVNFYKAKRFFVNENNKRLNFEERGDGIFCSWKISF